MEYAVLLIGGFALGFVFALLVDRWDSLFPSRNEPDKEPFDYEAYADRCIKEQEERMSSVPNEQVTADKMYEFYITEEEKRKIKEEADYPERFEQILGQIKHYAVLYGMGEYVTSSYLLSDRMVKDLEQRGFIISHKEATQQDINGKAYQAPIHIISWDKTSQS